MVTAGHGPVRHCQSRPVTLLLAGLLPSLHGQDPRENTCRRMIWLRKVGNFFEFKIADSKNFVGQCSKPQWRRRGPGSKLAPGGLGCAVEGGRPGAGPAGGEGCRRPVTLGSRAKERWYAGTSHYCAECPASFVRVRREPQTAGRWTSWAQSSRIHPRGTRRTSPTLRGPSSAPSRTRSL